ncbi:MAG: hypothetical protein SNJ77_10360 [Cytophagales bacterium]
MVKTVVTPINNSYTLAIPNNYIGKKIEILYYALDEIEEEKVKPKKTFANFTGVLSENDYQSLKAHTEQGRKEWNRDI